jgi:PHD/YefM family antitoxin component YafN of YafNO toxin-antitoxin module
MGIIISANELKTKGVAALDKATGSGDEAIIAVRGKNRFVVMPIEKYNYLRDCELETALREAKNDLAKGKVKKETVEKHIKRITRG